MKFVVLLWMAIALGCVSTHVRMADDIEKRKEHIHKVLVLTPEIDIQRKYIGTEKYFSSPFKIMEIQEKMLTGYYHALKKLGYEYSQESVHWRKNEEYIKSTQDIRKEFQSVGDEIIFQDMENREYRLSQNRLKKIQSHIPSEWNQYDAILFVYGSASLETHKESLKRWLNNMTYNLLLLPLAFSSYIFPVALPITLSTSTFVFKKSPDRCFFNLVMLDMRDQLIIYQSDYASNGREISDDDFDDIAEEMLEEMPAKKEKKSF